MSASQRRKGAAGERELADALGKLLGLKIQRELSQARDAGCDLRPGRLVVEVKRRKGIAVHQWMDQAVAALTNLGNIPVVAMRADSKGWMLTIRLEDLVPFVGEVSFLRKQDTEGRTERQQENARS